MKRRKVNAAKILVAAVVSSVGCNHGSADDSAAKAQPTASRQTVTPPVAAPAVPAAPTAPALPQNPNPALLSLSGELSNKTRAEVFAALDHYRPLCDREGFPLVGNVLRKSGGDSYKTSTFCSDLREQKKQ